MARYCLDASFILGWLIPDRRTPPLRRQWHAFSANDELVAPHLLLAECVSVIHEHAYRGLLPRSFARQLVDALLELPIRLYHRPYVFRRAFEIAGQLGWAKAYDAVYIAVVELEGAELLTVDSGMHQAARQLTIPSTLVR